MAIRTVGGREGRDCRLAILRPQGKYFGNATAEWQVSLSEKDLAATACSAEALDWSIDRAWDSLRI